MPPQEPSLTLDKDTIESIQNAQQAIYMGLLAYQSSDYAQAVEFLSQGLDVEFDYWRCHIYLAMAYYQTGMVVKSAKEFSYILNWCPNQNLRNKAMKALKAMEPDLNPPAQ